MNTMNTMGVARSDGSLSAISEPLVPRRSMFPTMIPTATTEIPTFTTVARTAARNTVHTRGFAAAGVDCTDSA